MRAIARILVAAGMTGALIGLAGCGLERDDTVDDMPTMSEAEVIRRVDQYADQVAALVGGEHTPSKANSAPCTGRAGETDERIRYVLGTYQIPLAEEKHIETLARVRDEWRAKGWTITDDRTLPDGVTGILAAKTNSDDYSVRLVSTEPPTALALLIHSTCYRSAD